jgi:hypothetical protein
VHGWSTVALLVAFLALAFSGDLLNVALDRRPRFVANLVDRYANTEFIGVFVLMPVSLVTVDLLLYAAIGFCSWRAAKAVRRAAAQLFWASVVSTVILDGGFYSSSEAPPRTAEVGG